MIEHRYWAQPVKFHGKHHPPNMGKNEFRILVLAGDSTRYCDVALWKQPPRVREATPCRASAVYLLNRVFRRGTAHKSVCRKENLD